MKVKSWQLKNNKEFLETNKKTITHDFIKLHQIKDKKHVSEKHGSFTDFCADNKPIDGLIKIYIIDRQNIMNDWYESGWNSVNNIAWHKDYDKNLNVVEIAVITSVQFNFNDAWVSDLESKMVEIDHYT